MAVVDDWRSIAIKLFEQESIRQINVSLRYPMRNLSFRAINYLHAPIRSFK